MRGLGFDWVVRVVVVCLVIALPGCSIAEARRPIDAGRMKQMLMHRGIGKAVKVTEADGTRVAGVLTAIHEDSFEVTPKNTFQATVIQYAKVDRVQGDTSIAAKVGKGIAIGAGAYVVSGMVLLLVVAAIAAH